MSSQSIVLTIHNKQDVIKKVIKGIYNNTSEPYELIIVLMDVLIIQRKL